MPLEFNKQHLVFAETLTSMLSRQFFSIGCLSTSFSGLLRYFVFVDSGHDTFLLRKLKFNSFARKTSFEALNCKHDDRKCINRC